MTHARAIAAAQTIPIRGDVAANLEQHLQLAQIGAQAEANVLVFPELSLTGYELALAHQLAFSEHDERLDPLRDAAASLGMTFIAGAPVTLGARLYIGAFIIAPDRSISLYTKRHLGAFKPADDPNGTVPPPEASVFHAGDRDPPVQLGDSTGAVAVCADVGHASHPEAAAQRGAKTYLASMFVIPRYLAAETAALQSYAARHSMAVVFANFAGSSGGLPAGGRSAIWSQNGELLVQLDDAGSGVAVAIESDTGWRARAVKVAGERRGAFSR